MRLSCTFSWFCSWSWVPCLCQDGNQESGRTGFAEKGFLKRELDAARQHSTLRRGVDVAPRALPAWRFYRLLGLGATSSFTFSPPRSMLMWALHFSRAVYLHATACTASLWLLQSPPRAVIFNMNMSKS